jgi:hypothetical protein
MKTSSRNQVSNTPSCITANLHLRFEQVCGLCLKSSMFDRLRMRLPEKLYATHRTNEIAQAISLPAEVGRCSKSGPLFDEMSHD